MKNGPESRRGVQIFDFQDVKIGKYGWKGHDEPAMMWAVMAINFPNFGQARFFSFDLSSAANCRATSVAALAIWMPKNRSNVLPWRLRGGYPADTEVLLLVSETAPP